ncbi:MAG TPA: DUF4260 domain-containing protein [Chitinophagaceae bacterium]|jgi:hypothetical protein|nr:DUF4260 domain-containing protein [Chitinophagaceae bacterium]
MKNILKLEEASMAGLSIYMLISLHADWWWYPLLVFGPDISMLGYLAGNRTGTVFYNIFHHKALALGVFVAGLLLPNLLLEMTGIVLFGHSSMDRVFGYGLKTGQGFKYTHLGMIGKK